MQILFYVQLFYWLNHNSDALSIVVKFNVSPGFNGPLIESPGHLI